MEFRALHEGFGAEASGVDVMRFSDPAEIAALQKHATGTSCWSSGRTG